MIPAPAVAAPDVSEDVALAVRTRAGYRTPESARCEACGVPLGLKGGMVLPRAGDAGMAAATPGDAVLMCTGADLAGAAEYAGCADRVKRLDPLMEAMGFALREGQDPLMEPVRLHGTATLWLAQDGTYLLAEPRIARAA